jgi:hypothetical protein
MNNQHVQWSLSNQICHRTKFSNTLKFFYFERFPRGTLIVKILKYFHQTRVFEVLSEGIFFILTILLFNV